MSTWTIILGYYVAAVLAGIALAVLRPLGNSRMGAFLGAVIGFLVYGSIGLMMEGSTPDVLWVAAIASLFAGGLGIVVHDEGFTGWSHASSDIASFSARKKFVHGVALAVALILAWLDRHHHFINK